MEKRTEIILIGPPSVGKTTQSKLLSEAYRIPSISLDDIAVPYYNASGFGPAEFIKTQKENGFLAAYRAGWPALAYAVERVVEEYRDCVFDFGGGHSHYEDKSLFSRVEEALKPFVNVVLLLPCPDLDQSISLLRERNIKLHDRNWIFDGYDFIKHWVKDPSNHELAKRTIYTEGKTPDQTKEEILRNVNI